MKNTKSESEQKPASLTEALREIEPSMPIYNEDDNADTYAKATLRAALRFIRGFEGDESQKGIETLIANLETAIAAPEPRIVIACDGGLVQGVLCDMPARAYIIDYDEEGADADEITKIPQGEQGGDENGDSLAVVRQEFVEVSASSIDRLLTNVPAE